MKIELYSELHNTWELHEFESNSKEEAVYKSIRKTHDFLTDDNHTYKCSVETISWGGEETKFESCLIYRDEISERDYPYCGPWANTDYWFSVTFREVK